MKPCWKCRIFGHSYYRGLVSWACTKPCCRNKRDAVIPARATIRPVDFTGV